MEIKIMVSTSYVKRNFYWYTTVFLFYGLNRQEYNSSAISLSCHVFIEANFREKTFPPSSNVNDYTVPIYRKYADLEDMCR